MKKILFLCNEGFDTPGPSNHLIATLIEDLLGSGYKITLLQSRRKRINNELPENLLNKNNLKLYNIDRKVIDKKSFVFRYLEEASYSLKAFIKWRKFKDIDAVFVQSSPTVVFSILLLKIFLHKPILYSVQDMWPGSAVSSGVLKNKIISRFFYNLQKLAYKNSDIITVISNDMKLKLIDQGVPQNKIYTIVNWFDDRTVKEIPWKENRFVEKYSFSEKYFYVQYAGTMGYVFDYKMIVNVATYLKDYKNIKFQMIGQGSQKEIFMKEVKSKNLDNISFFPLEPQNMVSDVYSACSASLIPLKKGIIGNSVPSKAGLLMACKRPIVNSVDSDSEYFRLFNENGIGISASNDNPEEVAQAILKLYKNPNLCRDLGENGQKFGEKYYSRSNNTKKFTELFYQITELKGT